MPKPSLRLKAGPADDARPVEVGDLVARTREAFVGHWGAMASCWGINPAMGKIHGLLYIVGRPLNADEIMDALRLSRAAVSMNLRDLIGWGVVRRVHRPGDRKEYFEAELDVWEMFTTILRERKRREVDPTIAKLEECLTLLDGDGHQSQAPVAPATESAIASPSAIATSTAEAPGAESSDQSPGSQSSGDQSSGDQSSGIEGGTELSHEVGELRGRLAEMLDFLKTAEGVFRVFQAVSPAQMRELASALESMGSPSDSGKAAL